jgi:hypothetical protein
MLHLTAARTVPSSLAPLKGEVDAAIMRAMAIEPRDRFASIRQFLDALRATAVGDEISKYSSEQALSVHLWLREGSIDNRVDALRKAEALLESAGFQLVATTSEGMTGCLRLGATPKAHERKSALHTQERTTALLEGELSQSFEYRWLFGEIELEDNTISGGDGLRIPTLEGAR